MKTITSLQNQLVKDAVSLHQKKYRDEMGVFLVEGKEPCTDAIARGWECVTLFFSPSFLQKQESVSAMTENSVEVTDEILAKISKKDNPQNVIGVFRQREFKPEKAGFTLALEEIRDPGNLGTIMRTAHAVNVKNIILIGKCCDPYAPEVIRASMGSFSFINLVPMSLDEFLGWQQKHSLNLLVTDVTDASDYRATDYKNAVLVMGNEQKGTSAAIKAKATSRVHIPMPGGTESLNLSIATGLLLYQSQNT